MHHMIEVGDATYLTAFLLLGSGLAIVLAACDGYYRARDGRDTMSNHKKGR